MNIETIKFHKANLSMLLMQLDIIEAAQKENLLEFKYKSINMYGEQLASFFECATKSVGIDVDQHEQAFPFANYNREQAIEMFKKIPNNTLFGVAIQHFCTKIDNMNEENIFIEIAEIKNQIRHSSENMKNVLGETFDYFKEL